MKKGKKNHLDQILKSMPTVCPIFVQFPIYLCYMCKIWLYIRLSDSYVSAGGAKQTPVKEVTFPNTGDVHL